MIDSTRNQCDCGRLKRQFETICPRCYARALRRERLQEIIYGIVGFALLAIVVWLVAALAGCKALATVFFTPAVGMRIVMLEAPFKRATITRRRKARHTITNRYSIDVRCDDGEAFTSVNGCWRILGKEE